MLSEAKHLTADRGRSFAEFTLSEAKGGSVTHHYLPVLFVKFHNRAATPVFRSVILMLMGDLLVLSLLYNMGSQYVTSQFM